MLLVVILQLLLVVYLEVMHREQVAKAGMASQSDLRPHQHTLLLVC